jgi:predicted  nucleic acid-binding Zn-ribbon protein
MRAALSQQIRTNRGSKLQSPLYSRETLSKRRYLDRAREADEAAQRQCEYLLNANEVTFSGAELLVWASEIEERLRGAEERLLGLVGSVQVAEQLRDLLQFGVMATETMPMKLCRPAVPAGPRTAAPRPRDIQRPQSARTRQQEDNPPNLLPEEEEQPASSNLATRLSKAEVNLEFALAELQKLQTSCSGDLQTVHTQLQELGHQNARFEQQLQDLGQQHVNLKQELEGLTSTKQADAVFLEGQPVSALESEALQLMNIQLEEIGRTTLGLLSDQQVQQAHVEVCMKTLEELKSIGDAAALHELLTKIDSRMQALEGDHDLLSKSFRDRLSELEVQYAWQKRADIGLKVTQNAEPEDLQLEDENLSPS